MIAERVAYSLRPDELRRDLHLSRERMARLVDVSAKTVERWEVQRSLPPRTSSRIRAQFAQIQAVRDLGLTVYTAEGFRQFLRTPLPTFDGKTPLQMIEQGKADDVIAALARGSWLLNDPLQAPEKVVRCGDASYTGGLAL